MKTLKEEEPITNSTIFIVVFIVGLALDLVMGHREEEPPYAFWSENGHINVAQERGSYVYTFSGIGGSYELLGTLGPNSPAYPIEACPPVYGVKGDLIRPGKGH